MHFREDFLQMAVPMINMNVIRDLADLVAQQFDIFHICPFLTPRGESGLWVEVLCVLCDLCG